MSEKLRVIFMGTAPLACSSLDALRAHPDCEITCVVTQPDRPKGRHLKSQPSAVKVLAQKNSLAVLQPEKARDPEFVHTLSRLDPDLIVVTAYGQILPKAILDLPKYGCLNVHTSLLPKYRGAAPIQRAILNGELETGVTLMKMDAGLDTGDIIATRSTPIEESDNAETLHDRLARLGGELLAGCLMPYVRGELPAEPQPESGISYARKITKEDGLIDWDRSATEIWNQVRGLSPWPGAYTFFSHFDKKELLKIWSAERLQSEGDAGSILHIDKDQIVVGCGQGALRLKQVQIPGGRRISAHDFLSGYKLEAGQRLG